MRNKKGLIFVYVFLCAYLIFSNIPVFNLIKMPNNFYVSYDEIERVNEEHGFGNFVNLSLNEGEVTTGQDKPSEAEVVFKLFGFIPVKKVKVKLLPEEEVYVGGFPIGLTLQTEGAVVVSDTVVDVKSAAVSKNTSFKAGDVIKEINGVKINSLDDIDLALYNATSEKVQVIYQRNNQDYKQETGLLKDENGRYKLGLWVRDDFSGVGTLTFIKKDTNEFGALGHAVTNGLNDNILPMVDGDVYSCSLVNVEKGQKNNPGELRCVFVQKNRHGSILKNTKVGIYGRLDDNDLIDQNRTALLGGRLSVKPGKAKIVSNVSGITEEYDIEIIKANFQSKCDDKSLVLRVTDKRLLELTGGIVQGMSGSPIIQNERVVGAVTHVFVSDPTKGYGVYTDWMLEQMSC